MTADPTLAPYGAGRVDITFAGRLENLGAIRTVVLAHAVAAGLGDDTAADLRLAVDEVCTAFIVGNGRSGHPITVAFTRVGDDVAVEISTAGDEPGDPLGEFTWHVLNSLADEVKSFHHAPTDGPPVTGVSLIARPSNP